MQNRNANNNMNNRYNVTKKLSPQGNCVVGIMAIIFLLLFGRLLLLIAIIGGIGWLAWKFRWALLYYYGQINRKINARAQAYQQKCQNQSSQQFYSNCEKNRSYEHFGKQ